MKKYDIYIPSVSFSDRDDNQHYTANRAMFALRAGNILGARKIFKTFSQAECRAVIGDSYENVALQDDSTTRFLRNYWSDYDNDAYFGTLAPCSTHYAQKGRHRESICNNEDFKYSRNFIASRFGEDTKWIGNLYCVMGSYKLDYDWDVEGEEREGYYIIGVFRDEKTACDNLVSEGDSYYHDLINKIKSNLSFLSQETLAELRVEGSKHLFDKPYDFNKKTRICPSMRAEIDGVYVALTIERVSILKPTVETAEVTQNEQEN
jgi:hypothetical protein